MDNPINVLSLCSGYAGIELGLESLGLPIKPVAYVEREGFAAANLVAKMETGQLAPAPIYTDVKTFPYADFLGLVDILTAGYPCQPFSAAGKRQGEDDPRHLWPHIARGIQFCRPGWVFLENVEGHISLGLSTVISDLEAMGYRATWGIFSAAEVGAPHQRKRVFILAYSGDTSPARFGEFSWQPKHQAAAEGALPSGGNVANVFSKGLQGHAGYEQGKGRQGTGPHRPVAKGCLPLQWPSRPGEAQQEWEEPRTVEDAISFRSRSQGGNSIYEGGGTCPPRKEGLQEDAIRENGAPDSDDKPASRDGRGHQQSSRQTQPELGRTSDGPPGRLVSTAHRVDRLRLLGNGVVAQTAAKAFATLYKELTQC